VTIPVLVGKKTYYVHQTLLTSSSKYFQNAMKPEWRIDPSKPIDLADAMPVCFEKYSQWLYTKQEPVCDPTSPDVTLPELYVFAERIMDKMYQRAIFSVMTTTARQPGLEAIRIIYAGTTPASPARRLMVDILAFQVTAESQRVANLDPEVDADFMRDLIAALVRYRGRPGKEVVRPWVIDLDTYMMGP
jgi:hypothetical protein